VRRARALVPSTARVYSAIEYNYVRWNADGEPCNTTHHKCIITHVAPQATVDYYTYSAWQTIPARFENWDLASQFATDLGFALNAVRKGRPGFPRRGFIIGEFGAAREVYNNCGAGKRVRAIIKAARQWGTSFSCYWQLLDNKDVDDKKDGFGAYSPPAGKSASGKTLRSFFTAGTGTWSCPASCSGC